MLLSYTEENYLKSIYHLTKNNEADDVTATNQIADYLRIKPATVTSMLKKLSEKKLITYQRYGKVALTLSGNEKALKIIRKHRLWEVFLVDKLNFSWNEVHEVAEQLEHIQSDKLIDKLDTFLGNPSQDPHGDPIPNTNGEIIDMPKTTLFDASPNIEYKVLAVKNSSALFLDQLIQLNINIGTPIIVQKKIESDNSMAILLEDQSTIIPMEMARNLIIETREI